MAAASCRIVAFILPVLGVSAAAGQAPHSELPTMAPGLQVALFAREPLVRNPCAMAFDARGRLFVGQGPQYRNPNPDTPGDSIVILLDTDGDGTADRAHTFAEGLNCIQGLAWHGRDLWVGNSPDLTIVRDLDGDDVADEYVKVYTDLGNLEHANHGHNWAPDGKLYFSHGTSKGLTQPGRVAPKPFRDLWDVRAPTGTPDLPPPQVFRRGEYRQTYQDPKDDWGREGGVLRCDDLGANLEIVARGMRNAWDIGFDSGFNWLGTDNDQSEGDRIIMPFQNAHFGWGHAWSTHWTGREHPPTAPVSGPVFDGSGSGIVYYDQPQLPAQYRGVWFINDWLRKTTFVYRPKWDGALLQPEAGQWQPVARGGAAARAVSAYGNSRREDATPGSAGALFKPVDIAIGPDGALYVTGWGDELGVVWKDGQQANEGRVFRIFWPEAPQNHWNSPKRTKPLAQWSIAELCDDLGSHLPVWNIDAQDELVRRGAAVRDELTRRLASGSLTQAQETWLLWTLGRLAPQDRSIDDWIAEHGPRRSLNARIQSLRIVAHRIREHRTGDALPKFAVAALSDPEPRIRFAAVQAAAAARQSRLLPALAERAAAESDRVTSYALWQAMRVVAAPDALRTLLRDSRPGVRRAALLALAESRELERAVAQPLVGDPDAATAELAATWLAKQDGNPLIDVYPKPGVFVDSVKLKVTPGIKPSTLRFTTDGSEPTLQSSSRALDRISETTTLKVALFVDGRQVGNTFTGVYRKRASSVKLPVLGDVKEPTKVADVMARLPAADPSKGPGLFAAAGCAACHRVGEEGRAVGPDLSNIGDRDDPDYVVRSILDPNQIVVEGYSLLTVAMKDGSAHAGIFEQENDRTLRLVRLDGEPVAVDKGQIASRQSIHQSPMPAYDRALTSVQVADLAAWLGQQRTAGGSGVAAQPRASATQRDAATFSWDLKAGRLSVACDGKPVADYVFSDAAILRPYFANVHAPTGVQVTRNHPPAAGDATDHATMHPGVWLAFGDINGEDFWRNKGRIEHVRFVREPRLANGTLQFATENRLLRQDGALLASQECRFELRRTEGAFLLVWESEIRGDAELVFGDQEEMGFGVRVATSLTEKAGGIVVSSEGARGAKAVWGKPAAWAVYSREIDDRTRGVALSPREPVWWHSRDYGVIVANSFGKRILPPSAQGKLMLHPGRPFVLRCAMLFFDTPVGMLPDFAALHREFQAATPRH